MRHVATPGWSRVGGHSEADALAPAGDWHGRTRLRRSGGRGGKDNVCVASRHRDGQGLAITRRQTHWHRPMTGTGERVCSEGSRQDGLARANAFAVQGRGRTTWHGRTRLQRRVEVGRPGTGERVCSAGSRQDDLARANAFAVKGRGRTTWHGRTRLQRRVEVRRPGTSERVCTEHERHRVGRN